MPGGTIGDRRPEVKYQTTNSGGNIVSISLPDVKYHRDHAIAVEQDYR